ncbi:hypothetical protein Tco_0275922 [Tanacetum coccineum]
MTTLKFADTYNKVAFLSKPNKSEGFEQIVDFLNANPIRYAITINPTIYTSCIEQFWATVKVKTVNREVQLQALVEGKKIIVTKASVRRDLQLDDEEGMDCFLNATIFEELTRIGKPKRRDTEVPQPSGPTNNVANDAIYKEMDDSLERAATNATSLDAEKDKGGGPRHKETMGDTIAQTRAENVSKLSNDLLLARGDTSLKRRVQETRRRTEGQELMGYKIIQSRFVKRVEYYDEEVLETEGPYHIDLPTLDDIHRFLQLNRVELNRTMKSQYVILTPNQILTKELSQDMKRWEELIRDDDKDDSASRASTPSPTTYLNSLSPLNYKKYDILTSSQQDDDLLFERQTDLLNQMQKMHEELRGGFKSFGKALKGVFSKKKK